MSCEQPQRAYRSFDGIKFFKRTDPQSYQEPYTGLLVPCGTCILCRGEQARQTAIRVLHESKQHERNAFVTATYDDNHLPEHNSLRYDDTTKLLKRLRHHYGPFRYYYVGEYGDKSLRPHYHLCIFGLDFTSDAILYKPDPNRLWISPTLTTIWGKGQVLIGALTPETANYTASYVLKKLRRKQQYVRLDPETGELIRVEQPRSFMSQSLAKKWFMQWHQGVADHDRVVVGARPQKPPRAYDRWLSEVDPTNAQRNKERREEKAKNHTKSKEQMRARARNAHARARLRAKSV